MRNRILITVCFWVFFLGMGVMTARATDVSAVPEEDKFLDNPIAVISAELTKTNEIRRPPELKNNEKASVGVWFPLVEPPPVERTGTNNLTNKGLIFRNVGSTSGKFPFVVKDTASGKFYVYRNVKYQWKFEKVEKGEDPFGGNVDGVSGGPVWSPFFYESKVMQQVGQFIPDFANEKVAANALPDPKVFVNRHTTVYDSGVMDDESVANSSILQQVGMLLAYEQAEVTVTPQGPGYPEKAQDTADPLEPDQIETMVKGMVKLDTEPTDAQFAKKELTKDVPAAYRGVWKLGPATAYKMVYVEDHKSPDAKPAESGGKSYAGSVGRWLEGGVKIEYVDTNPNAKQESPLMQADFKYNAGNGDIYKLPNPLYDGAQTTEEAYVYAFILRANEEFGPYGCVAQRGREAEWYIGHHPYWSKKTPDETKAYLKSRYANAWDIESLNPWEVGAIYYIAYNNGTFDGSAGKKHSEQLNAAWQAGSITDATCPNFSRLESELEGKTSKAAIQVRQALAKLRQTIADPKIAGIREDRTFTRFASAGFSPELGSYVVGRAKLEKDNPQVHREWNEVVDNVEVKKGEWTVAEKRIILPIHYSTAATDHCDLAAFSSKQVVTVSQSDCCGNSTSVEAIPTQDGISIRDDQSGSKPVPELSISDAQTNTESLVAVPVNDSLAHDEKLLVTEKATGASQEYKAWQYDQHFDMSKFDYAVKKADGTLKAIPTVTNAPNPSIKNVVLNEDVRVKFGLGGYDNIDGMTPFRGVGQMKFALYKLDDHGTRQAPEAFEVTDEAGATQRVETVVKENKGDPFAFVPSMQFYHIFRSPGTYQGEYELTEYGSDADKKSRKLVFNITVLDTKSQYRTIEQHQKRE